MRLIHRALITSALLLLGAAAALCQEAQQYTLYLKDKACAEKAEQYARRYLPEGAALSICVLPKKRKSEQDAHLQAQAIRAGITHLPSISVADAEGAYAVLPLNALNKDSLAQAHARAQAPERAEAAATRDLHARIFLLSALWSEAEALTDEQLEQFVADSREALQHAHATEQDKQFIGFCCLYPALMMQYTRGHQGAHTPYTEAKLLEAIAALEAARDLNRDSKLGKKAFAERERLRQARREARKYE